MILTMLKFWGFFSVPSSESWYLVQRNLNLSQAKQIVAAVKCKYTLEYGGQKKEPKNKVSHL
jgi:hypothetical protein